MRLQFRTLFPLNIQLKYVVNFNDDANKVVKIIHADQESNSPLKSIADVLIANYVTKRESYNYDNLKNQFIFIKNTSTRIVFKDNHRPSVVDPKVNDMNPYEKQEKCPKIDQNVCGNFTRPLYQYDVCG